MPNTRVYFYSNGTLIPSLEAPSASSATILRNDAGEPSSILWVEAPRSFYDRCSVSFWRKAAVESARAGATQFRATEYGWRPLDPEVP